MGLKQLQEDLEAVRDGVFAAQQRAKGLAAENYYARQVLALIEQAHGVLETAHAMTKTGMEAAELNLGKMTRVLGALLLLCALGFAVSAQEKPKPEPAQLTQVEALTLKNLQLEFQGTQQAIQLGQVHLQELRGQYLQYVAEVEKAHPGYTLDANGNLIEKPKPEKRK